MYIISTAKNYNKNLTDKVNKISKSSSLKKNNNRLIEALLDYDVYRNKFKLNKKINDKYKYVNSIIV